MPIVALETLQLFNCAGTKFGKNSSRRLRKKNAKSREPLRLYAKESKPNAWYSLEKKGKPVQEKSQDAFARYVGCQDRSHGCTRSRRTWSTQHTTDA